VRGHDKRSATGDRANQPRREEEVRVHDVGLETPRCGCSRAREAQVLLLAAAAPVEHRALDLVAAGNELLLQPAHEHAQVRIQGARIHLRDEQDPHRQIG